MYRKTNHAETLKNVVLIVGNLIIGLMLGISFWNIILIAVLSIVAIIIVAFIGVGILSTRGVSSEVIQTRCMPLAHAAVIGVFLWLGIPFMTMFWYTLYTGILGVVVEFLAPTYN